MQARENFRFGRFVRMIRPMSICALCGADWKQEPCDSGCLNDLDSATRAENEPHRITNPSGSAGRPR